MVTKKNMVEKEKINIEKKISRGNWQNSIGIMKKERAFLFKVFLGFLVVYSFLYGLWKIPVINFGINRMTEASFLDYIYVFGVTALVSVFLVFWRHENKEKKKSNNNYAGAAGGGFAAVIAGVCPVCQSLGVVAVGSTLFNIPTAFLVPYLGIIKTLSVGLLGLAVFVKADSINKGECEMCAPTGNNGSENASIGEAQKREAPLLFRNNIFLGAIVILAVLLFINQLMIPNAFAVYSGGGTVNLGVFEYGSKTTLKPMPLASGEEPKISGYKSRVKPLPTISELSVVSSTGDAVQDLLNNIVPTGTPSYGAEAGVSFDDPISAQNTWGSYEKSIQLDSSQQERWNRIVNSFTCDYCCGSPQNPTIITRCGCAHARAARGMAKWFIKNYGDKYSDEEIYGEMARWYALWYPKGTIERIIQEAQ